jgi:hypothetical protein
MTLATRRARERQAETERQRDYIARIHDLLMKFPINPSITTTERRAVKISGNPNWRPYRFERAVSGTVCPGAVFAPAPCLPRSRAVSARASRTGA